MNTLNSLLKWQYDKKEYLFHPKFIQKDFRCMGNWYCNMIAFFLIKNTWVFYFHWHIGKNDVADGFRMRVSEFCGKHFKIPFVKYGVA